MQSSGMPPSSVTKRDYYALSILQTLIASPINFDKHQAGALAVEMADILVAALAKPPKR